MGLNLFDSDEKIKRILFKNFMLFLVFAVVLITILGSVLYGYSYSLLNKEFENLSQNSLSNFKNLMENVLTEATYIAARIETINEVQIFFMLDNISGDKNALTEASINKSIKDQMRNFTIINNYIDSIYIYSAKTELVYSADEISKIHQFPDIAWLETYNVISKDEKIVLDSRKKNGMFPSLITLIKPIYYMDESDDPVGAVVINIDVKELLLLLKSAGISDSQKFYMLNNAGKVFYADDLNLIGQKAADNNHIGVTIKKLGDSKFVSDRRGGYLYAALESSFMGIKFISTFPNEIYNDKFNKMKIFFVLVFVFCIFIGGFSAYFLAKSATIPVDNIINALENPESFDVERFNHNMKEIKTIIKKHMEKVTTSQALENEIEHRIKMLNDAQALVLQSQINPHFLFNTLENIKWTALELTGMNENKAYDMISKLCDLLRQSQGGDMLVPAEKEILYTKLYLELMHIRYADKLSVSWEIDEEIYKYKLIKFMLQPVIENAIYHGIKLVKRKGNINIKGYCTSQEVVFEITDNGKGISEDKLIELREKLSERFTTDKRHIGLTNVNQRIRLMFGDNYNIDIESEHEKGTNIKLHIPKTENV